MVMDDNNNANYFVDPRYFKNSSLLRAFELQEQFARRCSSEPNPTLGDCLSFTYLSLLLYSLLLYFRAVYKPPSVNAYHIYIYIEVLKFYQQLSRVLASPSVSLSGIFSDVVNGNDDGICWHDLLRGGCRSAVGPSFMA